MNIKKANESELWEKFKSGDPRAFEAIYNEYFDRLYNYGRQFTKDSSLVEDTIHDLFIELRRRAEHLSSTNSIKPYLLTAYRRKIIRARDKSKKEEYKDNYETFAVEISFEDQMINDEHRKLKSLELNKSIEQLSEKHREIIFYFYHENLSYSEIQQVLGFENVKSVRNLLYKAISSLKSNLTKLILGFALLCWELCHI